MDPQAARTKLLNTLSELQAADAATTESRAPVELDQNSVGRLSRIDAIQRQEMALAGQQRRRNEMARIEAALRRIESGDFGYCLTCGEPIAEKRLQFDPALAVCVECAA